MSGRAPHPESSQVEQVHPDPSRAKVRILLPVALAVAVLAVFLIAFWPDSHSGKKGHARRGQSSDRNHSPVGGGSHSESRDEGGNGGNASVTSESDRGSGSPVGGREAPSSPRAKGETWWYQEKEASSQGKGNAWWYHEKKDDGKDKAEAGEKGEQRDGAKGESNEAPARVREAEAPKNSGPDKDWWHD